MKTAISLPDDVFRRVEQQVERLGVSRSAFFATAAQRYLAELDGDDVTARLDAAIARSGARATEERRAWAADAAAVFGVLDDDAW
ncbi:ribbon-helix-helix protein, CopG family [Microbacterium elymi]|uniref:Ribbon-helix-helix protein, CopG family n=1 Tax=Microbacterium elymi TaxID=2909587 RepID=A0ABY5NJ73_9MICO|nr:MULTISPECIES: ribbon-helix-helix protein, CopG family [Microbacterium]UUT35174.1 ribbon-helix-helix protein, CopG family [Microbacterium elymi]